MKNTRIYCVALLGLVLSGGSLLLSASPGTKASSDKDVVVTNTSGNPVPVITQGTTNVAGSVSVSNTPTVNINGTPNFNVANFHTQVPFHQTLNFDIGGGRDDFFTTEAEKTTFVRSLSAIVRVPTGKVIEDASVEIGYGSQTPTQVWLAPVKTWENQQGVDQYVINHEVDVRIPGGVFVQFNVALIGGEAAGHTTISFFGYTE
jgi:hypothetical protein